MGQSLNHLQSRGLVQLEIPAEALRPRIKGNREQGKISLLPAYANNCRNQIRLPYNFLYTLSIFINY